MASVQKSVRKTLKTVEVEDEVVTLQMTIEEARALSAALGLFGGSAVGLRGLIREISSPLSDMIGVWGIRRSAIELGTAHAVYFTSSSTIDDIYKI